MLDPLFPILLALSAFGAGAFLVVGLTNQEAGWDESDVGDALYVNGLDDDTIEDVLDYLNAI